MGLDIPIELVLKKGDVVQQRLYAYTEGEFTLALKVFANYNALAEAHVVLLETLDATEREAELYSAGLNKCVDIVRKVDEDRQFIYKLRAQELAAREKELRMQKIKTVLFTAGGGVVGIGAGILIGFIAAN